MIKCSKNIKLTLLSDRFTWHRTLLSDRFTWHRNVIVTNVKQINDTAYHLILSFHLSR